MAAACIVHVCVCVCPAAKLPSEVDGLKYVPPPREQQARTFPPFVVVACVCVCVCIYIHTHTHTHTHTRRKIQNTIAQCALCTMPTTGALQLALPRPPTHTARHHHHHHDDDDDDEEEGIGARVCARLHADHLCVCVCNDDDDAAATTLSTGGSSARVAIYILYTRTDGPHRTTPHAACPTTTTTTTTHHRPTAATHHHYQQPQCAAHPTTRHGAQRTHDLFSAAAKNYH